MFIYNKIYYIFLVTENSAEGIIVSSPFSTINVKLLKSSSQPIPSPSSSHHSYSPPSTLPIPSPSSTQPIPSPSSSQHTSLNESTDLVNNKRVRRRWKIGNEFIFYIMLYNKIYQYFHKHYCAYYFCNVFF